MLFSNTDFISTKELVTIHIDCNTIVANMDSYKETHLWEWLQYNDYDSANRLANFILWNLCPMVKDTLEGCTYSLSAENGVFDLTLSNATRCFPKARKALEMLSMIIADNFNGTASCFKNWIYSNCTYKTV